jgi:succinate dehydrogenase/fumarate reductase flavoprotein subunit
LGEKGVVTANGRSQNLDCDLLVIGGGAAGLSGAVTAAYHGLKVIVAEKASVLGGATSWSGGWMWVPLNPLSQAHGIVEDIDSPRTYLKHALGENYDEPRVEALLDNGRHMVAFFENRTALQFVSGSWIADIQGDLPGAGTGGRSVGPKPINMRRIKKALRTKLRPQLYETSLFGLGIMAGPDLQAFLHATTSVKGFFHAGWRVAFHVFDLATNRQGMQLVNGTALIARLAKSADDLGVPLLPNTPATRLLTEDGAVTGAALATPDGKITVRARRRPSGGRRFPHDVARRRELFPRTPTGREHWTLAPAETTGDGVSLGESAGGLGHVAGISSRMVSGVAGALPQRTGRHLPSHRRPGKARSYRRPVERQAIRQRSRRLLPVHQCDDRRRPRRRRGDSMADLRSRVPAPLPIRHVKAVPHSGMALRSIGIPQARPDARRTRASMWH